MAIDSVLRLLKNEKWHDLAELAEKFASHKFKMEAIVNFLSDYGFIEYNRKDRKVKLCSLVSSFIDEIHRVEEEEAMRALRFR